MGEVTGKQREVNILIGVVCRGGAPRSQNGLWAFRSEINVNHIWR
jgi:hypothetical protein